jgi:hypothetical protein
VDPKFAKQFSDTLGELWTVKNTTGPHHKMFYNLRYDFPLIIAGWDELKEYYHFPDNVELKLCYYGHNCFSIKAMMVIDSCKEILPFHGRCCCGTNWFELPLTRESILETKFVKYMFHLSNLYNILIYLKINLVDNSDIFIFIRQYQVLCLVSS